MLMQFFNNAISFFIELSLLFYFMSHIMNFKEIKNKSYLQIITYIILVLIKTLFIDYLSIQIFKFIIPIIEYASIELLYRDLRRKKIIWFIVFLFFIAISELVVIQIFTLLTDVLVWNLVTTDPLVLIIITIISKIALFFLLRFMFRLQKKELLIHNSFSYNFNILLFLSLLVLIGTLFIYSNILKYDKDIQILFMSITFMSCFVMAVSLLLVFQITNKSYELIVNTKKIHLLENEVSLNTQIKASETNLRAIRHNISNSFAIIKGLVDTKCYDELSNYIEEMNVDIQGANDITFLDNRVLSALLHSKKEIAKNLLIDFKNLITICNISNMRNSDLCDLMGNIWDNAIEAASQCIDLKYVQTTMQVLNNEYIIVCENSYEHDPIIRNGEFISSKKENSSSNEEHGIGTINIKGIVEEYNGVIEYHFEHNVCTVKITFPIHYIEEGKIIAIDKEGLQ